MTGTHNDKEVRVALVHGLYRVTYDGAVHWSETLTGAWLWVLGRDMASTVH